MVLLFIISGEPSDTTETMEVAELLKATKINLIPVGVGSSNNFNPRLEDIATDGIDPIFVSNVDDLLDDTVAEAVCAGMLHSSFITITCLYNFDPLKLHFYIVKLGFTGVYIIVLIFA